MPDCNKNDRLLTYSEVNGIGSFGCVDKGTESLDPADIAAISQTYGRLVASRSTVDALKPGAMKRPPATVPVHRSPEPQRGHDW